eukprot:gene24622-10243_t
MISRQIANVSAKQSVARPASVQAVAPPALVDRTGRRQMLSVAGLSMLALMQADAPAFARTSSLCTYAGDEADECRKKAIEKEQMGSYDDATVRGKSGVVSGVPVSVLDEKYREATITLLDDLEAYVIADPYDKTRVPLMKKLKAESLDWVAKYARGGSARTDSARRAYIAVDAVIGFTASNGLAPFPKAKAGVISKTCEEARKFLSLGK